MSTFAAYLGFRPAQAVLDEMLSTQEFLCGAASTGMVTCDEGRFHKASVPGGVETFRQTGISLPGNSGLAITEDRVGELQPLIDEAELLAVVNIGSEGLLSDLDACRYLAEALESDGAVFQTKGAEREVRLESGETLSAAEVRLFTIGRLLRKGLTTNDAIRRSNLRSETAAIYLEVKQPDVLTIVNHNQSVVIARRATEVYVVSSLLALPTPFDSLTELPMNTLATVTLEGTQLEPLWPDEARFDYTVPEGVDAAIARYLKDHPGANWKQVVTEAVSPLFPTGSIHRAVPIAMRSVERLIATSVISPDDDGGFH